MGKKSFVISDESVNSYGFVVKTDGIDTTAFERNPVMLYMHERKTVVGRWENLRKDGNKLLADAVFDDSTELGKTVKEQVEKGFLRSASIGVDIIEDKVINGVKTVTKCCLNEVSIVDIPANKNALKLYWTSNRKRLALEIPQKENDLRAEIITLLGLSDDVTNEEIITEIQGRINVSDETFIKVENAVKAGFIESQDKNNFLTMAHISPQTFHSFICREKEKRQKAVEVAVESAFLEGRIWAEQKELFARIGNEMGVETLPILFLCMPKNRRIRDVLQGDREGWTRADYCRYAPDELRNNPKLYAELIEKEGAIVGRDNCSNHSLDYLRKYNPEYLKEHPEEYERLLSKK
ncbi:MAG: HK97 family phage prohead protease [Prevotella sp.]|nr:HK97 family phage prohead protease [Prevotella sp.]